MFSRGFAGSKIVSLTNSVLYKKRLLKDVLEGNVFPAIRNDEMHFYCNGGRIFSFDNSFKTHIKYASILRHCGGSYILEENLSKIKVIDNFIDYYERIKENCSLYAGIEASGVYKLLRKNSYAALNATDIIVLDIEISFSSKDMENSQDRIDLLLFDRKSSTLKFIEVKHFSNNELWSREGTKPKVIDQIKTYENQIQRSQSEIISAYIEYVKIANELFGASIKLPEYLELSVPLLIFGFDRDQLKGRFQRLLRDDGSLESINYYAIGNIDDINLNTVWEKTKKL
ncbi:MAG: hypothetical protein JSW64_12655 [Candidatus Zixiibacteriota bacterium]|nr:MAG: hypothetical protein JSW64_12655 [candidate division Zixibacteria bacterium]